MKETASPSIMISFSAPVRRTATGRATPRTSVPPRAEAWRETARLGKNRRGGAGAVVDRAGHQISIGLDNRPKP